ncbi:MAG: cellulase family glycosylhydrolase [Deltaproteobacteria bacterium]|nr:cellulase family glycosylhydrolase [Deltaproteobacteria bacterium]
MRNRSQRLAVAIIAAAALSFLARGSIGCATVSDGVPSTTDAGRDGPTGQDGSNTGQDGSNTGQDGSNTGDDGSTSSFECSRVVDDDETGADGITYSGTWESSPGVGKYGGTDHYTDSAGASGAFTWVGGTDTSIVLHAARASHHGQLGVTIDGATEVVVDLYASTRTEDVAVHSSGPLAAGQHTITWRWMGTNNASSSGTVITIDRLDVTKTACSEADAGTTDAAADAGPPATGFLTRQGTKLYLNGAPYRMVGVNAFDLTGCGLGPNASQLDAFFAGLRAHSLVRTWCTPNLAGGIDAVVQAAANHGHMLIFTLTDGRSGCGDVDGAPNGDGSGKNLSWYQPGGHNAYLAHVTTQVQKYKDSPAIGMWELANEPGGEDINVLRAFFDETAALIKGIDPNHLVETGTWPPWAYGDVPGFEYIHAGPNIDVGSMHEYDYDYNNSRTIKSPHYAPALQAMTNLDKVLIVGETGIKAGDNCWTSRALRASELSRKFDAYLGDGAAGVFVWNWFPANPGGCTVEFGAPDPLMPMIHDYPL